MTSGALRLTTAQALVRWMIAQRSQLLDGTEVPLFAGVFGIFGHGNVLGLGTALHGTSLWIDAGFSDVADCAFWLPLGATLVIGTESLAGIDDWVSIRGAFGESVLLSLDYDAEGRRGPAQLFDDPALWPGRLIVMSLARVGIGAGPDLARIEEIESKAGGCAVYAAGGVRDASDLAALMARGASGALVGTALHAGALTQKEIAALFRERRP